MRISTILDQIDDGGIALQDGLSQPVVLLIGETQETRGSPKWPRANSP